MSLTRLTRFCRQVGKAPSGRWRFFQSKHTATCGKIILFEMIIYYIIIYYLISSFIISQRSLAENLIRGIFAICLKSWKIPKKVWIEAGERWALFIVRRCYFCLFNITNSKMYANANSVVFYQWFCLFGQAHESVLGRIWPLLNRTAGFNIDRDCWSLLEVSHPLKRIPLRI